MKFGVTNTDDVDLLLYIHLDSLASMVVESHMSQADLENEVKELKMLETINYFC